MFLALFWISYFIIKRLKQNSTLIFKTLYKIDKKSFSKMYKIKRLSQSSPKNINEIELMVQYCKKDHVKLLKQLISKGPKFYDKLPQIFLTDFHSNTISLIHICAAYGSVRCFKYLLDKGLDPQYSNNENVFFILLWNCLHFACCQDKYEIVKILIERGLSMNEKTNEVSFYLLESIFLLLYSSYYRFLVWIC
jgi:hypothetical protein